MPERVSLSERLGITRRDACLKGGTKAQPKLYSADLVEGNGRRCAVARAGASEGKCCTAGARGSELEEG
jgi:hypothetical protein